MADLVEKIVAIAIGLFVAAIIVPIALVAIANSESNMTTEGVNPAVITIVVILLPVLAVIAIAMWFLRKE
jgi:heme/copper-type cytochrome/quinol oxidase subunit 2